ncbi:sensor histidine kinase [Gracilibacillus phocaeensis]|uniref:sensor histidine kinase n=1 Tax=Gracilibacillus phocaeensis TaxID=2042304 RepID=UPI0013EEF931|nr:histidine kinase [Gracilibacillus phocaeensis]
MAEKNISTTTNNLLNIADWNITTFIHDFESISNILLGSNDIQSFLKQQKDESYAARTATNDLLANVTNNKSYINGVYIGNQHVEHMIKTSGESKYAFNIYHSIQSTETFEKIVQNNGNGIFFNRNDLYLLQESRSITYGKVINDINNFNPIGILVINFDEDVFHDMFSNLETTGNIAVANADSTILYNKDTSILSDAQIAAILPELKDNSMIKKEIDDRTYIINSRINQQSGFRIVSATLYQELIKEAVNLRNITSILILIAFIIAIVSAFLITQKITKQLTVLSNITNKMEDRKEKIEHISFDIEDEIGKIGNRLIYLYNRNNDLLIQLYETKLQAKESELITLQNHINPHFLYNTLNSIYWLAEKNKVKPIADMALNMSEYYKLVLNNGDHITTVRNEIIQIQKYLQIMNVRYNGTLDITYDIEEELLDYRILKLLIQPLVENAVTHGLSMKTDNKKLEISASLKGGIMCIAVIDNGIGFEHQPLIHSSGYALKNIDHRIKLFYGENYGLTIESEINKGTTATIIVKASINS